MSRADDLVRRFDEAFLDEDAPVNAMAIARKYLQKHKDRALAVISQMVGKLKREGSKDLEQWEKALDIVRKQVKYTERARQTKPADSKDQDYKTTRYKSSSGGRSFEVTHWLPKKKAAEGEE